MRTEYPRRYLKTWRQLVIQGAVSALILQVPLIWRFTTERLVISIALGGLALSAITLYVHCAGFLLKQEAEHPQPTPEMSFVFMLAAVYPLAICVFLLILLGEM